MRGSFVRGDDEIDVELGVAAHHVGRSAGNPVSANIPRNIKECSDENFVARIGVRPQRAALGWRVVEIKPSLAADGDDDGVLHVLRGREREDFGAEIGAIAPPQAAARNAAKPKMNACVCVCVRRCGNV